LSGNRDKEVRSMRGYRLSRRHFLELSAMSASLVAARGPMAFAALGQSMSHRERIERALRRQPTDRLPWGFWWHFPNRDRSPRRLAELSLELQRRLDTDFIKFSPYGLYSVVDWGVTLEVRGGVQTPIQESLPIQQPLDWTELRRFLGDEGEYMVVLEAQRIALEEMAGDVPLVQTVFSPLTSCLKMAGPDRLLQHLREAPQAVHAGLEIVTETTCRFARAAVTRGADGLFFATQNAGEGGLTRDEFAEFARPYDLAVLNAVKGLSWFNVLHLHGADVMFDQVLDYPVQAVNYHDREFGPPLSEMRRRTDRCLIGGIERGTILVEGTLEQIDAQVKDAWEQMEHVGLILGPGCVANVNAPEASLLQLRRSVEATAHT